MTLVAIPHGGDIADTRTFEVSYRRLKALAVALAVAALLFVGMALSWWYVAAQAARVPGLVRLVEATEGDRQQVAELAAALETMEVRYGRIRAMLGADNPRASGDLWLPSLGSGGSAATLTAVGEGSVPDAWPLTERGFITREHVMDARGEPHPGLDVAVPEGSYIRAAGAGRVIETGEDSLYGKFVRVEHADGYETLYGHASEVFARRNDPVERHEVIALTGSTGRSTAPHLHFEVRRNGDAIDPRTVIDPPSFD